jgi:hypothetical protein
MQKLLFVTDGAGCQYTHHGYRFLLFVSFCVCRWLVLVLLVAGWVVRRVSWVCVIVGVWCVPRDWVASRHVAPIARPDSRPVPSRSLTLF